MVNYQHFKDTGELTFYANRHTNGYIASVRWLNKAPYNIFTTPYPSAFKFTPTREFKREIAKVIQSTNMMSKYYER